MSPRNLPIFTSPPLGSQIHAGPHVGIIIINSSSINIIIDYVVDAQVLLLEPYRVNYLPKPSCH